VTFELMLPNGDLFAVNEGNELERELEPLLGGWGAHEDAAAIAALLSRTLLQQTFH